jgi:arsenate reductase-like glutaredoxin family protein
MNTDDVNIIDLQEESANRWYARYLGNRGIYTVKINFDQDGKISGFSCTCPNKSRPCKHIGIIKQAIVKRRQSAETQKNTPPVENLSRDVSPSELRYSTVAQTGNEKFSYTPADEDTNPYSAVLRDILEEVYFVGEKYHEYEKHIDIDDYSQWLEKARDCAAQGDYGEAVLICKACIEELAEWMYNENSCDVDHINPAYQSVPFEILETVVTNHETDFKALYDYCLSETDKDKYVDTEMFDYFNDLLTTLAVKINSNDFIALQDSMLKKITDDASIDAEKILNREIRFYNAVQQPEKAAALIEKNIQIENFRYRAVEKLMSEQNYTEAKRLTDDFIQENRYIGRDYAERWDDIFLEILQKENNTDEVRATAFELIEHEFIRKYFDIYKSTFAPEEWNDVRENLLQHYEKTACDPDIYTLKHCNFSKAAADVLVAEGEFKRLILYLEKNMSIERLDKYYRTFVDLYPEKTLKLFRKTIDDFVEKNVGRMYYKTLIEQLKQIRKIKNGDKMVARMIADYRKKYTTRHAMLKMLNDV